MIFWFNHFELNDTCNEWMWLVGMTLSRFHRFLWIFEIHSKNVKWHKKNINLQENMENMSFYVENFFCLFMAPSCLKLFFFYKKIFLQKIGNLQEKQGKKYYISLYAIILQGKNDYFTVYFWQSSWEKMFIFLRCGYI